MSRTIKVFGVTVWPPLRARVAALEAKYDQLDQAAGNVTQSLRTDLEAMAQVVANEQQARIAAAAATASKGAVGPKRRRQR